MTSGGEEANWHRRVLWNELIGIILPPDLRIIRISPIGALLCKERPIIANFYLVGVAKAGVQHIASMVDKDSNDGLWVVIGQFHECTATSEYI